MELHIADGTRFDAEGNIDEEGYCYYGVFLQKENNKPIIAGEYYTAKIELVKLYLE